MRITHWSMFLVLAPLIAGGSTHAQQGYPIKPIRLIVPFPPGGGADIVARVISHKAAESFGVAVVVDNRAGAAGMIGTDIAVKSNPDGYTMILVEGGYAGNAALYTLPYDPLNDVTPVALVGETGFIVTLHPSVPVKTVKELLAYDKVNPGKLNYGSGGTGSSNHLVIELFNQATGAKLTHVPYKGIGLALNDLLGGQIQIIFGGLPPMLPHIKANRLRGIAVTTAKRSSAAPDVPTVADTVPGYEAPQWFAVLGPKALLSEVVARWNKEIDRIVQLPDVRERMANDGLEPAGGSPDRLRDVLRREIARWQKVVKAADIKPTR
jgi:tripartite-type tricarboxylate transporter receptor subunit TctC